MLVVTAVEGASLPHCYALLLLAGRKPKLDPYPVPPLPFGDRNFYKLSTKGLAVSYNYCRF